jgi:TPR repeat protein
MNFFEIDKIKYDQYIIQRYETYNKGINLIQGKSNPENILEGLDLLYIISNYGYSYSYNAIGLAYCNDYVENKSFSDGIKILMDAFDLSNPKAALNLSNFYEKGFGVEKDINKSKYYQKKAIEFAVRFAYKKDQQAIAFLKDLNLSDKDIDHLLLEYQEAPICDICEKIIPLKNKNVDIEKYIKNFPDDIINILKMKPEKRGFNVDFTLSTNPVLPSGICCMKCFQNYIIPLKDIYNKQKNSLIDIDILINGNSVADRLLKIRRLLKNYNQVVTNYDQDDIFPFELDESEYELLPLFKTYNNTFGFNTALLNIGIIYENGDSDKGIVKNIRKAIYFYKFSIDYGNPLAIINLCNILFDNPYYRDVSLAWKLVLENIELLNSKANIHNGIIPYNIGLYYYNGHLYGKPNKYENFIQAKYWLNLALNFGHASALTILNKLNIQ